MVLLLTNSEIKSLITMREAIEAVERGFADYSSGKITMPPRTVLTPRNGWTAIMSVYMKEANALATKIVTVYPENVKFDIPVTVAILVYSDPANGIPLAIMDATYLTTLRTGAASGVATKHLARARMKEAETLTIIGCGTQAETQLEAMTAIRNIRTVNACDINAGQREQFSKQMREKLELPVNPVENVEKAVREADILITVTTSKTPVVKGAWISEGCPINAVGAHMSNTREFDNGTIKKSKIIVDSRPAAFKEAGDLVIPIRDGILSELSAIPEIGEIIAGKKRGRTNPSEITFFKSTGLAVQDWPVAKIVYEKARKHNAGKEIELLNESNHKKAGVAK